jgi:hypothetical protein
MLDAAYDYAVLLLQAFADHLKGTLLRAKLDVAAFDLVLIIYDVDVFQVLVGADSALVDQEPLIRGPDRYSDAYK